jgi:superfamily II DNA or RNA helicase
VSLDLGGHRLGVDCTCPHFDDTFEPCKHIWAAILAADAAKAFQVPDDIWIDTGEDRFDDSDLDDEIADEEIEGDDAFLPGIRRSRFSPEQRQAVVDRMKRYWAARGRQAPRQEPPPPKPPPPPAWKQFLSQVTPSEAPAIRPRALPNGELVYVFDPARSAASGGVSIELLTRQRKQSGEWAKPRTVAMARSDITRLPDERDRWILDTLCGAMQAYGYTAPWGGFGADVSVPGTFLLSLTQQRELTPRLCETGRLLLRLPQDPADARVVERLVEIDWDPEPARFQLRVTGNGEAGYTIAGRLRSGEDDHPFTRAMFLTSALILWHPVDPGGHPRFAAFETGGADRWMTGLLDLGSVTVPAAEAAALLETLARSDLASLDLPGELRVETRTEPPRPALRISSSAAARASYYRSDRLDAKLSFRYGTQDVDAWSRDAVAFDRGLRASWRRDREAEGAALARLQSLGVRKVADVYSGSTRLDLTANMLPRLVRVLLSEGWHVEADGRLYRRGGVATLDVRSGIDWFELRGAVDFDGVSVGLPALLAAARRGDGFVALGDGTFGLLPEEWLARAGRIASLGTPEGDHVRFAPTQRALLDAWLATQPAVSCDEAFAEARRELERFEGLRAVDPPPTFQGALRDYQRDALGWFEFLRRFKFGGCLADEMGLGKTVMVLAALEARRLERERTGRAAHPSVVVVPKSLVFNWRREAARFTPALRVLDYTGGGRGAFRDAMGAYDVVLTTYGTLRKDAGHLKDVAFDYAILDEAQAIKNAATSSAKAARLLKADHRLALSGTPVENHLGELWSLFDFLNPGILGASSALAAAGASGRTADDETLALLARGLRPFILRRTKEQVARELPERTEQTLYCDLEPPQRALYNELRDHYRASLLGKVARVGLAKSKLQVLEALLRLRQAACHPGLIDRARAADAAAKLDVLVPRLQELADDGRKVLVFSQFTSLLALLRTRLDEAGLTFEYLDGRTRDREARVRRFQDDGCPLFLISLKAGGLGLNLTAAEYVFLLDPWWNPAVEAQAIDRAHRIGQTRPVFAFRLIARDTVEEKVLELQATKRRLADAIVRADASLIRDLRREDLELLLS